MRRRRIDRVSRRPGFAVLLAAVLLIGIGVECRATISSVGLAPAAPTEEDPILISVAGWLPDGCWSFQGNECGPPLAGEIAFDIFTYDEWQPGYVCIQMIIPYGCDCSYGPLAAGHYVVTVVEHHESLRNPDPETVIFEFDVVPASPVRELSWSSIRALYR